MYGRRILPIHEYVQTLLVEILRNHDLHRPNLKTQGPKLFERKIILKSPKLKLQSRHIKIAVAIIIDLPV